MVPDFVPVAVTQVDWPKLLLASQQALGRSVSASLDAKRIPAAGLAAFAAAIAEFQKPGSEPISSIRDERRGLMHIYVTLLIVCDREVLDDLGTLGLTITSRRADPEGWVAVASGTMQAWFFALLDGLRPGTTRETRILLGKILLWFERSDLQEVWGNYCKRRQEDGTFILESK